MTEPSKEAMHAVHAMYATWNPDDYSPSRMKECGRVIDAAFAPLRAENERMRKALHRIRYEPIGPADASAVTVLAGIVEIAEAALAKEDAHD